MTRVETKQLDEEGKAEEFEIHAKEDWRTKAIKKANSNPELREKTCKDLREYREQHQ